MDTRQICRLLEWDSDFFGFRIGRLEARHLTAGVVKAAQAWCIAEDVRCLYFLADGDDRESARQARLGGFRPVDERMTFERHTTAESSPRAAAGVAIRAARDSDIALLCTIAREAHRDTRFHHDPGFDPTTADALYTTWIANSCRGFADTVLVPEIDGVPVGYITCHKDGRQGQIGLLAIAPEARARGIGARLVATSMDWFREHNVEHVSVVTQGRNALAQRLYERNGFKRGQVENWYHGWFNKSTKPQPPEVQVTA